MSSTAESDHPVILFDGVCNLCTGSVQFVIERDSRKQFRFASLQSPVAERLLGRRDDLESMVLVEDGALEPSCCRGHVAEVGWRIRSEHINVRGVATDHSS